MTLLVLKMPTPNKKLPPLEDEAFEHGHREKTEISFNKCPHDDVILVSGLELKCAKCSAGWTGPNILQLYKLLKK